MKTIDIEEKIKRSRKFDTRLITNNPPPRFADYLRERLKEKGVKKAELIKAMNVQRNYGYQMLNGTRTPTRVQLIRIALYIGLDTEQTQKLLNLGGREALYVRRPEDARTVHCLEHKMEFKKACSFIWKNE